MSRNGLPNWLNRLYPIIVFVIWLLSKLAKLKRRRPEWTEPEPDDDEPPAPLRIAPEPPAEEVGADLVDLAARARALGESCRRERQNARFVRLLVDEIPAACAELRALPPRQAAEAAETLEVVLGEVSYLIRLRRDPELAADLADADALADACYAPVVAHARAEGLPLTTAHPAVQLGDFDLAIWTGFVPFQVAPIFVPRGFFDDVTWWPALAHEIGHDFLASVEGLDAALRSDLGLGRGGAWSLWFEELFCDVFATLMLGPAYVLCCKVKLTRAPDATGCDPHPAASLRVLAGCAVLERAGFFEEAKSLRGGLAAPPEIAAFVERLYAGPLTGLNGFGLQDVSGLDYGPAEHAAARAAREALLAGRVPGGRDPRALIAGAMGAWAARPDAGGDFLRLARAAIGRCHPAPAARKTAAPPPTNPFVDALILREVLQRPRSVRR